MACSSRIDVPDGCYHVLNRGVERRQIFPDEGSNLHFLETAGEPVHRFLVAQLAARFDGTEALETLLKQPASEQKSPLDRVIPEGLRVIERLEACGLILLEQG
jgi:hypothetical protein